MRVGVLRGRDHTGVGEIALEAEGAAAVAISRGGAAKRYAHRDANEDAAAFASGQGGCLLVVADAHAGHAASELAVEALLDRYGAQWTGSRPPVVPWPELAAAAVGHVHGAVVAGAADASRSESRTTLSFALVRPADDWLAWASVGDSHLFRLGAAGCEELAAGREDPSYFVGAVERTDDDLATRVRSGSATLAGAEVVVAVTDGLSERGIGVDSPESSVREVVGSAATEPQELRALTAARGVVECALAAHRRHDAGDNVAVALYWPVLD